MAELNLELEFEKARAEYFRHLTTLSTGSIILIVTFLEKLFKEPIWKPLVVVSLLGFMVSVIASILAYTLVIMVELPKAPLEGKDVNFIGASALVFSWLGFVVGIGGLTAFAIRNLII